MKEKEEVEILPAGIKKVSKPWGYEIWWAVTDRYVGKVLHIKKGERLSYQYHKVKDETIYLYSGKMELTIEEPDMPRKTLTLSPGDSIRIKPLTKHRMLALEECEVLEVSTPEVDDLVRLEDKYGRT